VTALQKAADLAAAVLHGLGRRIDRFGTYAFLDARQGELGGVAPLDLGSAVRAYAAARPDMTFVQIGAHEGGEADPLGECIRALRLRGVLVEPQPGPFARLQAVHADQPQLSFERAAVAAASGVARFYRADPAFWRRHGLHPGSDGEIASLRPEQIRFHVALFGGEALAAREVEYLVCDEVPALSLPDLLAKHRLPRPDLLQIDAEGFDYEVLKMVDWSQPPPLIHFETVHLREADRIAAWELLRGHAYRLYATDSYNTLAIGAVDRAAGALAESAPSA
jgi:FkbM family methyltransferase